RCKHGTKVDGPEREDCWACEIDRLRAELARVYNENERLMAGRECLSCGRWVTMHEDSEPTVSQLKAELARVTEEATNLRAAVEAHIYCATATELEAAECGGPPAPWRCMDCASTRGSPDPTCGTCGVLCAAADRARAKAQGQDAGEVRDD
ncbi:MAG: hypothetical protein Q8S13_05015, partial [Dehalococcoidia bacterium]|nr:hypothetical protein [Dehalococcoidia bacterium]